MVSELSLSQPMPEKEMRVAEKAALECDLFIVIGSSLKVYPAANLPIIARKNGSKLIIINRENTELDSIAHLVINDEIGKTLSNIKF